MTDSAAVFSMPGPPGPPHARHLVEELMQLYDLQKDVLGTMAQRFAIYGDFYRARARDVEVYSTCDPELIHQVLVAEARAFNKRTIDLEVLGSGLLTNDGEDWRRQRRRIQPGFRHESIARYAALMAEEAGTLLAAQRPGSVIELRSAMMELTLRVVCRALFGQHFTGNSARLSRAMRFLQEQVVRPKLVPGWVPTPTHLWRRRMHAVIDQQVFAIIDQGGEPGSLLAELTATADQDGKMSRQQLRDEIVTLFLAGHETTALALTWALYLLALHPEIDAAAAAEVRAECGADPIGTQHLERLELCQRVIKETLRLYPPAYVVPRVCAEPVTIGAYRIQPGAEFWLWIYFMQRDARWFERPDRFEPDRFLPGGEVSQMPRAYAPFGAGSRACVGQHFAMLETVIVLGTLLRSFRLRPLDGRTLRPFPRITLAPGRAVRVRLEARH